MKELVFNHFYFRRLWWSWKNSFWTVSAFRGCGGLERTNFEQSLLSEGVVVECGGVVFLKELILNSFHFGRVWWSWKNWFWTVSTLGGSGGHERTDFEHFLLSEGEVVLKELILNSFYFQRVWWSWKNWFWTVSNLGGSGDLEWTHFEQFLIWWGSGGLETTLFEHFLLSEGVVVLKGLILNCFYFQEGVVVLKELILNTFYFQRVRWSWKNWFSTISILGGCGGLERTHFEQFLLWEGVVVLKQLFLNSFYFQRVW